MSRIDESKDFVPVRIAVLTVSDTRQMADDKSGQTLVDRIAAAGHLLADRKIIPDERDQIAAQLRQWCADDAQSFLQGIGKIFSNLITLRRFFCTSFANNTIKIF